MGRRVDARDVLDANARTRRGFGGRIVGYYRRVGPNRWDDYEYVKDDQGPIDVNPGLRVQLEPRGVTFRMRSRGKVIVVQWVPDQAARAKPKGKTRRQLRELFVAEYLSGYANRRGLGGAAVIARKLGR